MARTRIGISGVRRFGRLPREQRRVFLAAWFLLPVSTGLLRLFGYRRLQRWASRLSPLRTRAVPGDRFERALATRAMVMKAARRNPIPSTCLSRSVVLDALLRRAAIESDLRFGARQGVEGFEAHAWVEVDGRALELIDVIDRSGGPFLPFHPPAGRS